MLVSLKTLQDDIFTVEIDPSETVKCFKEKIEKERGDKFPALGMRLMYAGKFLLDNKKVRDYNVEEKKFVIVVVKKPKLTIKKEPDVEMPESSSARDTSNQTGNEECVADEALVEALSELGFPAYELRSALESYNNDPDRAIEYLMNMEFDLSHPPEEAEGRRQNADYTTDPVSDPAAAHLLRSLSSSGSAAASHPGSSSGHMPSPDRIMQIFSEAVDESRAQIIAADRELERDRALITQNFEAMQEAEASVAASSGDSNRPRTGYGMAAGPSPPPMFDSSGYPNEFLRNFNPLNLCDSDHQAITRLKELGFSLQKAIEAYLVCERNEHAAADFLFSQNFD